MTTLALPTAPSEVRELIREGRLVQTTSGMSPGHVQANLAILPKDLAFDFLLFCQRNPRPCPLLEVVEAGDVEPAEFAPGADLRTDTPLYRVYEYGEMTAEVEDISEYWRDDLVSFLLGCSFSFENALLNVDIPIRHMDQDTTVPMFITNIPTASAGAFSGPMVVSMRADQAGAGREGRAGDLAVPGGAWRARPHRRPVRHRHQRRNEPRLRRSL